MSWKKPTTITAWSFSRYYTYKQCPLKAKLKFIDKIPEPGNAAMDRGNAIHKMAEDYINGGISRIPKELSAFTTLFKQLRVRHSKKLDTISVEETWAFTKNWQETTWNDWANCWLRVKTDCAHLENPDSNTIHVYDWKSGKFREDMNEDYVEQLELSALAALKRFDYVENVNVKLKYLDADVTFPLEDSPIVFTRADEAKLLKTWTARIKPMLNDRMFAPRPNDKCKWCHFRKSNSANGGGQCKF
jgi:CRISPR/Cas system-associated exonuclease Cas4 (RecB family)